MKDYIFNNYQSVCCRAERNTSFEVILVILDLGGGCNVNIIYCCQIIYRYRELLKFSNHLIYLSIPSMI